MIHADNTHTLVHLWKSASNKYFINIYFLTLGTFIDEGNLTNLYQPHDYFIFLHKTNGKDG